MPSFIWPGILWGLLVLPAIGAAYLRAHRRTAPYPVSFSTTGTLQKALAQARWRRYLAPAVFLLGLGLVVLAAARPMLPLPVPADRAAIVLAMDISGSMRSMDIEPNRLEAAKRAAQAFIEAVPDRVRIGLVAFAGFSTLLAAPTTDHQRLGDLIEGLWLARRTAIGEGLLEAVAALPERARPGPDGALPPPSTTWPPGFVVLLSDGRSNTGIDPLEAAEIARRQQVIVYTVGVGGRGDFNSGWTIGGPPDEETLQAMATIAGGTYYHASRAEALHTIYRRLARRIGWERRPTEVSAAVAGGAAVLLITATALSWALHPLRP